MKASVPMHKLEKLTSGRFHTFVHRESGRKLTRHVNGIQLPAELAKHVHTFTGLHGFPLDAKPVAFSENSGFVTPSVISKAYGIPSVSTSHKNIQSIGQFQGQYVSPTDLSNFCQTYDSGADCQIEKFIGENNPKRPGVESMLDAEYIMGLGQDVRTWVYSYPDFDFCGDLLTWASDVASESEHPFVVSLSYGSQKIGLCDSTTMSRLSEDVQKLAGMGITTVMPSYQATAVKAYLDKKPEIGSKKYASGGRATPDVSLLGENFAVVANGRTGGVGGTSASTPSWGAIISLLNEACLSASGGSKTLGFVNPLFYSNPDAFSDITMGNNAIGENEGNGWKATEGWDAVTGLGSPNFSKLQTVVQKACGGSSIIV